MQVGQETNAQYVLLAMLEFDCGPLRKISTCGFVNTFHMLLLCQAY